MRRFRLGSAIHEERTGEEQIMTSNGGDRNIIPGVATEDECMFMPSR